MSKKRVDVLLVERGLVESRTRAQALIMAGKVFVEDRRVEKAGERLTEDVPLSVRGRDHPYVSRGGVKLAGALDAFGFDPTGLVVADFGASTGGFSDCLLQRGAKKVYAIDVGYGQLADPLRRDERVVVMERTNARHIDELPEPVDLVVIDASFISIVKLLPAAKRVLGPAGAVIGMIKPQFEVGRAHLDKGVVKDQVARADAIARVASESQALGFSVADQCDSVLAGPEGNLEAFILLVRG